MNKEMVSTLLRFLLIFSILAQSVISLAGPTPGPSPVASPQVQKSTVLEVGNWLELGGITARGLTELNAWRRSITRLIQTWRSEKVSQKTPEQNLSNESETKATENPSEMPDQEKGEKKSILLDQHSNELSQLDEKKRQILERHNIEREEEASRLKMEEEADALHQQVQVDHDAFLAQASAEEMTKQNRILSASARLEEAQTRLLLATKEQVERLAQEELAQEAYKELNLRAGIRAEFRPRPQLKTSDSETQNFDSITAKVETTGKAARIEENLNAIKSKMGEVDTARLKSHTQQFHQEELIHADREENVDRIQQKNIEEKKILAELERKKSTTLFEAAKNELEIARKRLESSQQGLVYSPLLDQKAEQAKQELQHASDLFDSKISQYRVQLEDWNQAQLRVAAASTKHKELLQAIEASGQRTDLSYEAANAFDNALITRNRTSVRDSLTEVGKKLWNPRMQARELATRQGLQEEYKIYNLQKESKAAAEELRLAKLDEARSGRAVQLAQKDIEQAKPYLDTAKSNIDEIHKQALVEESISSEQFSIEQKKLASNTAESSVRRQIQKDLDEKTRDYTSALHESEDASAEAERAALRFRELESYFNDLKKLEKVAVDLHKAELTKAAVIELAQKLASRGVAVFSNEAGSLVGTALEHLNDKVLGSRLSSDMISSLSDKAASKLEEVPEIFDPDSGTKKISQKFLKEFETASRNPKGAEKSTYKNAEEFLNDLKGRTSLVSSISMAKLEAEHRAKLLQKRAEAKRLLLGEAETAKNSSLEAQKALDSSIANANSSPLVDLSVKDSRNAMIAERETQRLKKEISIQERAVKNAQTALDEHKLLIESNTSKKQAYLDLSRTPDAGASTDSSRIVQEAFNTELNRTIPLRNELTTKQKVLDDAAKNLKEAQEELKKYAANIPGGPSPSKFSGEGLEYFRNSELTFARNEVARATDAQVRAANEVSALRKHLALTLEQKRITQEAEHSLTTDRRLAGLGSPIHGTDTQTLNDRQKLRGTASLNETGSDIGIKPVGSEGLGITQDMVDADQKVKNTVKYTPHLTTLKSTQELTQKQDTLIANLQKKVALAEAKAEATSVYSQKMKTITRNAEQKAQPTLSQDRNAFHEHTKSELNKVETKRAEQVNVQGELDKHFESLKTANEDLLTAQKNAAEARSVLCKVLRKKIPELNESEISRRLGIFEKEFSRSSQEALIGKVSSLESALRKAGELSKQGFPRLAKLLNFHADNLDDEAHVATTLNTDNLQQMTTSHVNLNYSELENDPEFKDAFDAEAEKLVVLANAQNNVSTINTDLTGTIEEMSRVNSALDSSIQELGTAEANSIDTVTQTSIDQAKAAQQSIENAAQARIQQSAQLRQNREEEVNQAEATRTQEVKDVDQQISDAKSNGETTHVALNEEADSSDENGITPETSSNQSLGSDASQRSLASEHEAPSEALTKDAAERDMNACFAAAMFTASLASHVYSLATLQQQEDQSRQQIRSLLPSQLLGSPQLTQQNQNSGPQVIPQTTTQKTATFKNGVLSPNSAQRSTPSLDDTPMSVNSSEMLENNSNDNASFGGLNSSTSQEASNAVNISAFPAAASPLEKTAIQLQGGMGPLLNGLPMSPQKLMNTAAKNGLSALDAYLPYPLNGQGRFHTMAKIPEASVEKMLGKLHIQSSKNPGLPLLLKKQTRIDTQVTKKKLVSSVLNPVTSYYPVEFSRNTQLPRKPLTRIPHRPDIWHKKSTKNIFQIASKATTHQVMKLIQNYELLDSDL